MRIAHLVLSLVLFCLVAPGEEVAPESLEPSTADAPEKGPAAPAPRYGTETQGAVFGFSPLFHPRVANSEELGHGASSSLLLGYRIRDSLDLQFRYQGGTIPSLLLSDSTSVANVKAKLFSFGFEFNIPLNDPFDGWKGFQFYVPLNFAAFSNWVSIPSKLFLNFGVSGGSGAGVRYYTGTFVVIDAVFVYHFSVPFTDIDQAGSLEKPVNAAGNPIKGSTAGPELWFSVTLLF